MAEGKLLNHLDLPESFCKEKAALLLAAFI